MRRFPLLFLSLALCALPAGAADEPDEATVKAAGLSADPAVLLDFVHQRARETGAADDLVALVKELGSADPKAADKAAAALIARGPVAMPVLRRAANDLANRPLAERARKALGYVEGRMGADIAGAVVRLLGAKRPAGSVEALLAYLPYADDASVLESVGLALGQLAYADGKAHPALLKALESDVAVQRAAAVEALAKTDRPETRPAITRRLTDPAPPVRQRAALALARVEDIAAIPVLVDLMGELSRPERTPVDEMLRSLAGETAPKKTPTGDTEKDRKELRDVWAAWWRKVDGPSLVDEFRIRTLQPSEKPKVAELIQKLGDPNYRVRERATNDLVGMGAKVLVDLRAAARDSDGERARRAEDCVAKIYASETKRVPIGTARLTALRRPDGATEAMLAYLPFAADDDGMIAEVKSALTTLALDRNANPDPALRKALTDSQPVRRGAAAEALAKGGGPGVREDVKRLLKDPDLTVRQAAATALTVAGERDAVPVLIDLLAELPPALAWPTQDLLHQLAGDKAPTAIPGDKPDERKKYRDAWAAWWKENAPTTNLARLTASPGYLGFTILVEVGNNSVGRVTEIGRDGKVRWQVTNLRYPVDAFVLPGERVLITEWDGNRVAEWDFRGNLVWKQEGLNGRATNAQRLPNGHTFICTTNEMLEVDRTGKTVYRVNVPQGLTAGYRWPNGDIFCLRNDGQVVRYDVAGKELGRFPSNRDTSWTSGIDMIRNGNVLVTQPSPNQKVVEYSPDGKAVREWYAANVTTATRLANGNILAASHNDMRVVEYDSAGKKVWEHKSDHHIFRARRR
ncbi:MAG TPA: HEAT repeat domain-containing protein [Gemmataceae bacterium]|nr:HEAT repeat domain-containing protein [Gemmataceae bacterium]